MNAVVLAGGGPDAVSALQAGAANKAFVVVGGTALVARALTALRATARVAHIVAVAPPEAHAAPALAQADERRAGGARIFDSLVAGLAGFASDQPVLVAASDLPILTAAAVDEFLDRALARDLDVAYAILERRAHDARYPRVPHTWARMRDGAYCGGGLVLLKPRVLARLGPLLDALGAARKSPLRLAALFGWDVLARFAFGVLRVEDAEQRAGVILGAPAGAIRCTHPEVAVNVDRVADVALANELLAAAAKDVA